MDRFQILCWEVARVADTVCVDIHNYKDVASCLHCISEKIKTMQAKIEVLEKENESLKSKESTHK